MLLSRNEWLSLAAPFFLARFTSSLTILAAEEGESEEENDFFFSSKRQFVYTKDWLHP